MDPITTAIVAALAKLAEPAIKDAYDGLKAIADSPVFVRSMSSIAAIRASS
jgi:hypothetical protein